MTDYVPTAVLSPAAYNRIRLMLCCLMTTRVKGHPFEVAISGARGSVMLADQVKSLDWRARKASLKGHLTQGELAEVRAKALALISGR